MRKNHINTCQITDVEEGFLFDVQYAIQALMREKNISNKELADLIGVKPPRVSEMLSPEAKNLTLRTVGRIFAHLGEEPEITSAGLKLAFNKAKDEALADYIPWEIEGGAQQDSKLGIFHLMFSGQSKKWTEKEFEVANTNEELLEVAL